MPPGMYSTVEFHPPPGSVQVYPIHHQLLHRLEVVGLLDLGLPLLPHRLLELLPLRRRLDVVLDALVLLAEDVDGLVLQGHLGGEGLEVALGKQLGLEGLLALGRYLSLLL